MSFTAHRKLFPSISVLCEQFEFKLIKCIHLENVYAMHIMHIYEELLITKYQDKRRKS